MVQLINSSLVVVCLLHLSHACSYFKIASLLIQSVEVGEHEIHSNIYNINLHNVTHSLIS